MSETSELWWVSVGGNPCEPARVVISGADRKVFTIGCNDGTWVEEGCGIKLVSKIGSWHVPPTPTDKAKREAEWAKQREADRTRGISHNYRTFP